ncbi:MAG: hypothetical protein QOI15_855, partial [Pseudonocardiales bacterium]|nr:hypothetical protein [Pseudonocardiales bacterium]
MIRRFAATALVGAVLSVLAVAG